MVLLLSITPPTGPHLISYMAAILQIKLFIVIFELPSLSGQPSYTAMFSIPTL